MRRIVAVAVVVGLLAAGATAGEAPKPMDKGQVILSWDEFVKITGYDPTKGGPQAITVPWSEVEALIGIKIQGVEKATTVNLPWQEFKALLEWSLKSKGAKAPPPTDFIIASTEYGGELTDDGATLTLKAKIEVLREEGWTKIPLLPATVALTKTTLPDGVYLHSSGDKYELLTNKTGSLDIEIAFSVAVEKEAGVNRVTFPRVAEGSSVLDLSVAREDVEVKVAQAQSLVARSADGKTQVAAALPAGVPLTISWERALPKVEKAPTRLYAETQTLVAVAEGVLLCQETASINILHTGIRELKFDVPAGTSVLDVSGTSVQDWRTAQGGELTVLFSKEMIGSQSVQITFERPATDSVEAPVIRPQGVEREKGFVGVVAVTNVEIAAGQVTGATSIDVRELPAELVAMTNQPILLGFRYVADTFALPLTIKKHAEVGVLVTIVDSALFTAMQLEDGRRMTKAVYSVRNNRNQFLRLKLPEDAEIWSAEVGGNTVSPAKDEEGNVLIPLVRSAAGARELAAFPVDLVYVQTPDKPVARRGTVRVDLPTVGAPAMHVMVNYYVPPDARYRKGWGRSPFAGPLRHVDGFTTLATGPQAEVIRRDAANQVAQMQQQVEVQVDRQARKAGATPIRVRLPINGKLFRFEKILALPGDQLWFSVDYSGWEQPE